MIWICIEFIGRLSRRIREIAKKESSSLTKLKSDVRDMIWPGVRKARNLHTDGVPITSATETSKDQYRDKLEPLSKLRHLLRRFRISDNPRSVSLMCPVADIKTLSGFKSLDWRRSDVDLSSFEWSRITCVWHLVDVDNREQGLSLRRRIVLRVFRTLVWYTATTSDHHRSCIPSPGRSALYFVGNSKDEQWTGYSLSLGRRVRWELNRRRKGSRSLTLWWSAYFDRSDSFSEYHVYWSL